MHATDPNAVGIATMRYTNKFLYTMALVPVFAGCVGSGGDEPQECGAASGIGCSEGEFCKLEAGSCEDAEAIGECMSLPDGCPEILQPVGG